MAAQYNPYGFAQQQNYQMPTQQIFPSPQGNVYQINSSLEVANVPASTGINIALCLNEGMMYIKSLQNNQPTFWAYKLQPYVDQKKEIENSFEERLKAIEEKLSIKPKESEF